MLLEGVFIPLSELKLSKSDTADEKQLTSFQNNLIKGRLSYFSSADFCNYKVNKLLEFDTILTAELYSKWEQLLVELDLVHQVYLYFLSNSKITVDVKCAFLIELAEPLIEVVKEHTKFFFFSYSRASWSITKKLFRCFDNEIWSGYFQQ